MFKRLLLISTCLLFALIKTWGQESYNMDNNYAVFRGHPKAKGLDFKLMVPQGWKVEEGNRPNIVCKLTCGHNYFMVIVRDNITFISRNMAKEICESGELDSGAIEEVNDRCVDSKILAASNTEVDTYPARLVETQFKIKYSWTDKLFDFKSYMWYVMYEDLMICILASGPEQEFARTSLRFHQIVQSLVFFDHYER